MPVWIGTSGWQYRSWRGPFYPPGLPASRWLEAYAAAFATVESNSAFYRLPEERTVASWAERSPPDFVWAIKASRFLTHVRRLRDPEEPVETLLARLRPLGPKLGPILVQLPPSFTIDPERLAGALHCFPAEVRVALEFRHDSWFVPEVEAILREHRAALCLADRRGPVTPVWRTVDWTYLRFHEGEADPPPCYGDRALAAWARRLAEGWSASDDVYVYFNNDPRACAPENAIRFARAVERVGLEPTRVPEPGSIRVAGS